MKRPALTAIPGLLLVGVLLLLAAAVAGCGGGGSRPVTVTEIPYGTVTVANENVGSVFICKSGHGLRIKDNEDVRRPGGIVVPGKIHVWHRNGKDLVTCIRH